MVRNISAKRRCYFGLLSALIVILAPLAGLGERKFGFPSASALETRRIGAAAPAPGCSTVVVGKKASLTGEVLLGHNEDNEGRLAVACYKMPRLKHSPGEMIVSEEGRVRIPQVAETAAFLWWETIASWKASFSDNFINEYGVAVVSDSCWPSKETKGELVEGGIGYSLRRIIAERAKTAREGVELAAALVDRYGYADSGRTYIIADKNEGWLFEVVMGKHYAARRVADDEVAFIPNWYTIRDVDLKDKASWIVSPDIVTYAIKRGWFTPKAPGDASGFDFARAYMSPELYDTNCKITTDPRQDYNVLRHKYALEMITGQKYGYSQDYPFAVTPAKRLGLEDLMRLLRTHYEGEPDYRTTSPENSPHSLATICSAETQESLIVQFRDNPDFTVIWWAAGRPCTSCYVPWYLGIEKVPDGYGWKDPIRAMAKHFEPSVDDLSYDPARAWWAFMDLQNVLEPRYFARSAHAQGAEAPLGNGVDWVRRGMRAWEEGWLSRQAAVETESAALWKKDPDAARDLLTRYTAAQAKTARDQARRLAAELAGPKIRIRPEEVRMSDIKKDAKKGNLTVTIFSSSGFDASKIDPASVRLGPGYLRCDKWLAGEGRVEDVDKDGKSDLIMSFKAHSLLEQMPPCRMDLWVSGRTIDGKPFGASGLAAFVD